MAANLRKQKLLTDYRRSWDANFRDASCNVRFSVNQGGRAPLCSKVEADDNRRPCAVRLLLCAR